MVTNARWAATKRFLDSDASDLFTFAAAGLTCLLLAVISILAMVPDQVMGQ